MAFVFNFTKQSQQKETKMKKIMAALTLAMTMMFFIPVANAQQCTDSVNLYLNDKDNTIVKVDFLGVSNNGLTWSYQFTEQNGKDLSHGNIIRSCLDNVISWSPSYGEKGKDGSSGDILGIKWDVDDHDATFSTGEFSITLDAVYEEGTVQVLAKAGNSSVTGNICGPLCSPVTFAEEIIFDVAPANGKVILNWTAISEENVRGYNIFRKSASDDTYVQINENIIYGKGNIETTVDYKFEDDVVQNRRRYEYLLVEIESDGREREHGPITAIPRLIYSIGQ